MWTLKKPIQLGSHLTNHPQGYSGFNYRCQALRVGNRIHPMQVTELQTELAKLGFTRTEIVDATESILKFATANRRRPCGSRSINRGILRAFGLDAKETDRVVSRWLSALQKAPWISGTCNPPCQRLPPLPKSFNSPLKIRLPCSVL